MSTKLRRVFFRFVCPSLIVSAAVLFSPLVGAQTALVNGTNLDATLLVNTSNSYTFSATTGNNIQLRVGSTNFVPRIDLYRPDGTLMISAYTANGNNRDASLLLQLTNTGTFTAVIESYFSGGSGSYALNLAQIPGAFVVAPGDDGGALGNGVLQAGTIALGDLDMWSFSANSGDSIQLRMGATGFVPRIDLYAPDGTLINSAYTINGNNRDASLLLQLTNSGTFTVVASSYYLGNNGTYVLSLARVPGAFVVSPNDEGGALVSGVSQNATIVLGDLDMWTFTANAGNSIQLRMGATGFVPRIDLYAPDGTLVSSAFTANGNNRDAGMSLQLTNTGTFTVVASSYYLGGDGDYSLDLATIPSQTPPPGGNGGVLTNGALQTAFNELGNLDLWTFAGNAGDNIQVRMGATNFVPRIDLYGPDGTLISSGFTIDGNNRDAGISLQLTNSGTFTAVASSYYLGGSGGYEINLAHIPGAFVVSSGDEGGALNSGVSQEAAIALGDLDMWTFTANAGNSVQIRMGATNFVPRLDLYGPDGALLSSAFTANGNNRDAGISLQLTNTGTFTVVASSYYLGGNGGYLLDLAIIPTQGVPVGGNGGPLTNGLMQPGFSELGGLDLWTFSGNSGDNIQLRVGATNFVPRIDLYEPDGTLMDSAFTINGNNRDAALAVELTNTGTFTAVVSSYYLGGTGGYALNLSQAPETAFVTPGDEGGMMTNGFVYNGVNSLGDLDVFQFYGTPGDSNMFRIGTVGYTPLLDLYDPSGQLVASAFTANGNNRTNFLSYVVTNAGVYTLVSSSYFLGGSGTYNLKQSRVPPDLNLPPDQNINEGTSLLNLPVSAQDPDDPNKSLTFILVSAPPAMTLATLGPTNAALSWATGEADGPSTNLIVATVTDVVNGKSFTRTNTFTVIVNELNTPPHLTVPAAQVINELTPLSVTATATDADLPANTLTFGLLNPPTGMNIDPNTGAITWTPTEAQGPSVATVTVVVTDYNQWAINSQHMSDTNSFTVTVNEVNTPPQITVPANQTINEQTTLSVSASATDNDLPANPLTFTLVNPPQGMTISPTTGAISWTPTEAQGPSTNTITVVVTDSSPQAVNAHNLSATNSFVVTVNEVNTAPVLTVPANQTLNELTTLSVTASATDSDLPANPLTFTLLTSPQGMTISPTTGAISWTPTEAQGPSTNTITVVVTDSNPKSVNAHNLSATNSFVVTVNEVNTAPVLTVPSNQTLNELTTLSVTASATDSDLPANPLTFTLLSPPQGMTISPTTGAISWTPTEAEGPSTNIITIIVTDSSPQAVNAKQLSATNTFTVTVNEVNTPPVLTVPANQTLNELTTLSVTASATDSDLPANPLTFTLLSPPQGMTISPTTGAISWTPTEAQGPSTNTITVVVTDSSPQAVNATQFSVTNTFTVTVNEVNSAPVLTAIPDQSVHLGVLFTYQAVASDSDIPTNTLTFSLDASPSNMTINASSGLISWTPAQDQTASYPVTVRVTDNGVPPLSAVQSFHVTVAGHAPSLAIAPFPGGLMQITVTGDTGFTYLLQGSQDLANWSELLQFNLSVSPYQYLDPGSVTNSHRFYRLQLSQ